MDLSPLKSNGCLDNSAPRLVEVHKRLRNFNGDPQALAKKGFGLRIDCFLNIPRAAVQGVLLIPRRLQIVEELKVRASLRKVSVLVEREDSMPSEGRRKLLGDQSCSQFT